VKRATNAEREVAKKNQAERLKQGLDVDWPDENTTINTPDADGKRRKKIESIVEGMVE